MKPVDTQADTRSDRFDFSRHALPTPYEDELLKCAIEECAEIIERISKVQRFGPSEVRPGQYFNNVERMSAEIGDLLAVLDLLEQRELVDQHVIRHFRHAVKPAKLQKFMKHRPD